MLAPDLGVVGYRCLLEGMKRLSIRCTKLSDENWNEIFWEPVIATYVSALVSS